MSRTARIAAPLTILGLIADLAYLFIHAATLFLFDGMWLESAAFAAIGSATIAWISTIGVNRTRALLARTSTNQGD